MSALWLHPALAFLAGALALLVLPRRARPLALLGAPAAALLMLESLARDGAVDVSLTYLGATLTPLRVDALSLIFARIFVLAGGLALLYGLREASRLVHAAALVTVGAALGVVLAGDLLTLFIAWEVKSVATAAIVLRGGMPASVRAALRYLLVHTAGGSVLLVGIVWWSAQHGLAFDTLSLDGAGLWILVGFAVNAAIPPLHAWLTDAYPEASPFGAVLLSAFTTKAAVYVLVRGFPGAEPLVIVGACMALYGVIFAILENDIRRLLAYHIVSQVGFMVCGVGLGFLDGEPSAAKIGKLALNGTTAHAVCHILYKGLLLMATGAVVHATGLRRLDELGGLRRRMPLTMVVYLVAAFSISGVPLFSGFVSKAMVVSASEYAHRPVIEWMLVAASIGTFLSTGLKLPWFLFFGPDRDLPTGRPVPWNMTAAMLVTAALCTLLGLFPQTLLYPLLPYDVPYEPFTVPHVLQSLQLLLGTAVVFVVLLPKFRAAPAGALRDAGGLYRLAGRGTLWFSRAILLPAWDGTSRAFHGVAHAMPRLGTRIAALPRAPVGIWVMVAVGTLALLLHALRHGLLS